MFMKNYRNIKESTDDMQSLQTTNNFPRKGFVHLAPPLRTVLDQCEDN